MADNKKYYYIKFKEDFFDNDAIKILEAMPDGYIYSNILLKMYLKSLKNAGKLMFSDMIPYSAAMLATVTGHQLGTVEKALGIFRELGLIEVLDNGTIYMLDIQNFIGKSSTEADRQREYRGRIKTEKASIGQMSHQMIGQTYLEIRDRDRDRDRDREYICASDENVESEPLARQEEPEELSQSDETQKPKKSKQPKGKKTVKHTYGEYKHVKLTDAELEKLNSELGEDMAKDCITHLDEYIELKGAKYKNHYLAIRKWVIDAVMEKRRRKNKGSADYNAREQLIANRVDVVDSW